MLLGAGLNITSGLVVTGGSGSSIVTDGLVLNLDAANPASYSGAGTTWYDLSGNGNNGTLVNNPTYTSGPGGYFTYDGVDDYTSILKNQNLGTTQNYTLFLFVNFLTNTTLIGGYGSSIVDSGSGTPSPMRFLFMDDRTIKLQHSAEFASPNGVRSITKLDLNTWYCIAASNNINNGTIYINGVINNSASLNNYWDVFNPTIAWKPAGNPSSVYASNCNVGNLFIYNRALSSAEITQNFNALRGRYGV